MPRFTKQQKEAFYIKLLENGEALFIKLGFNKVSIDDITKACGLSHGAFYSFFKNKEHMLMTIINNKQEMIFEDAISSFQSSTDLQARERLIDLIQLILMGFTENPIIGQLTPDLWEKIQVKVPEDAFQSNIEIDSKVLMFLRDEGMQFKYDNDVTLKVLHTLFHSLMTLGPEDELARKVLITGVVKEIL